MVAVACFLPGRAKDLSASPRTERGRIWATYSNIPKFGTTIAYWDYPRTRQAMYVQRNMEELSCNHRCSGKAISITYSECVSVALVFQHARRMRRILLSSVACPALPYSSTLSDKRYDFRKKKLVAYIICGLIFSTIFDCNISHSKKKLTR